MRKIFLTGTALMGAAALSAPAFAADGLEITAFSNWTMSAGTNDTNPAGGESSGASQGAFASNSEIHFNWSKTSESGITYGFKVELEADQGAGGIDENGVFFAGSFGTIKLEQDDGAGDTKITGTSIGVAYGQSANPTGTDMDVVRQGAGWTKGASTGVGLSMDGGDDPKISYYIPAVVPGLTVGVSYAPTGSSYSSAIGAGVKYSVPLGESMGLDLAAAYATGGYLNTDATSGALLGTDKDSDGFTLGAKFSIAGFKISGGYSSQEISGFTDSSSPATVITSATDEETEAFSVGIGYGYGPVAVNVLYNDVTVEQTVVATAVSTEEQLQEISAGVSYNLMPGVTVEASALRGEVDNAAVGDTRDFSLGTVAVRTSW